MCRVMGIGVYLSVILLLTTYNLNYVLLEVKNVKSRPYRTAFSLAMRRIAS